MHRPGRNRVRGAIAVIVIAAVAACVALQLSREARRAAFREAQRHWAEVRLRAARQRMDPALSFWAEGTLTVRRYYDDSIRVLKSERDLNNTPAGEMTALIHHRDRIRVIYDRVVRHPVFQLEATGPEESGLAEHALAEAELWITRAKLGR